MSVPVAYGFRTAIVPGPAAFGITSIAFDAATDGSFWSTDGRSLYAFSQSEGTSVIEASFFIDAVPPQPVLAAVSAQLVYVIDQGSGSPLVSQWTEGASVVTPLAPLPGAETPAGISAASDGTLWALGGSGTIYSYTSPGWTVVPSPGGTVLVISVGSAAYALAVTGVGLLGSTVMAWNGTAWNEVPGINNDVVWAGACPDGSYWWYAPTQSLNLFPAGGTAVTFTLDKPPLLNLLAAPSRWGCYVIGGGEGFLVACATYGVTDSAPIPWPAMNSGQQTSYDYINGQLGISDPNGIRAAYANAVATLSMYFTQVSSLAAPSGVAPADWSSQRAQILTELQYAQAVQNFFNALNTLSTKVGILQLTEYNSVVQLVGLPDQPGEQPQWLVDIILGMAVDKLFAAAVEAAPANVQKAIGLTKDIYHFASSYLSKQNGAPNDQTAITMALARLSQTMADQQTTLTQQSGQLEAAILADWGKLGSCGHAMTSSFWFWDPNFDYSVLADIGAAVELQYFQTIMPAKWQILQLETIATFGEPGSNPFLPDVPAYALIWQTVSDSHDDSLFWWRVCADLGAPVAPDTNGPFPNPALVATVLSLSQQQTDLFTGQSGWALPVSTQDGYLQPPAGVPFQPYDNSTSPIGGSGETPRGTAVGRQGPRVDN